MCASKYRCCLDGTSLVTQLQRWPMKWRSLLLIKCTLILMLYHKLSGDKLLYTRHFTSHPYTSQWPVKWRSLLLIKWTQKSDALSRESSPNYMSLYQPSICPLLVAVNETDTKSYVCEQIPSCIDGTSLVTKLQRWPMKWRSPLLVKWTLILMLYQAKSSYIHVTSLAIHTSRWPVKWRSLLLIKWTQILIPFHAKTLLYTRHITSHPSILCSLVITPCGSAMIGKDRPVVILALCHLMQSRQWVSGSWVIQCDPLPALV